MLNNIELLHERMRNLIVMTPVGTKRYDRLLHAITKRDPSYIKIMYDGLLRIFHSEEYDELFCAYNLSNMTPERWEAYKLFRVTDLEEQKRLRAAGVAVAKLFKTFFKELSDDRKKKTVQDFSRECRS